MQLTRIGTTCKSPSLPLLASSPMPQERKYSHPEIHQWARHEDELNLLE
jgi:hypothetical protein